MPRSAGIFFIVAGILIALIGVLVSTGTLFWFGHLPGDIRVEKPNARVFIPITSCLIVSIAFSLILYLFRRWLR
jgi:membrane protein implicated in regulation of membrane protease activity